MGKMEIVLIKMTGKNYVGWSFHVTHYGQGKGLAGFMDSSSNEPTEEKA